MIRNNEAGSWVVAAVVAAAVLFAAPGGAQAGQLLQFTFQPGGPAIQGAFGTLSYDATSHQFQSTTTPLSYTSDSLASAVGDPNNFGIFSSGAFNLGFLVDNNGDLLSGSAGLNVTGSLDLDQDGTDDVSGSLLTGTVTAFGSDPAGPATRTFDGLIRITGGALAGTTPITISDFGANDLSYTPQFSVGQTIGFVLSAENTNSGILGDFTANFSSGSTKVVGGSIVPEPTTLTSALTGALTVLVFGWLGARRGDRRRR